jgi:hypothetical protein
MISKNEDIQYFLPTIFKEKCIIKKFQFLITFKYFLTLN